MSWGDAMKRIRSGVEGDIAREAWRDGFQTALDAMREWAEKSGDEHTREAIKVAANMIEATKP